MDKIILKCDVCGSPLTMQSGGQSAACEYCGMQYAIPRLREKIQEIRGTVSVEGVVKTASADFDIQAGVLLHYRGKDTTIVVPDSVLEIGPKCFENMRYISAVSLPMGLKSIGAGAFSGCANLSTITLPDSLNEIGDSAFSRCTGLKSIHLPDNIEAIGRLAFYYCSGLTDISLPARLKTINNGAFAYCTGLKKITLPNGLKEIGELHYDSDGYLRNDIGAFQACIGLKEIAVPESVTEIGYGTFSHCTGLEKLILPQNLNALGCKRTYMFEKCNNLHTIIGPNFQDIDMIYVFPDSPWRRAKFRQNNLCQYCGRQFAGLLHKKCTYCSKPKDY